VRAKVKEEQFNFPVVADNDKANWDSWGNAMWPSVYLVDKGRPNPLLVVRRTQLERGWGTEDHGPAD
jgi:hypothetical protein